MVANEQSSSTEKEHEGGERAPSVGQSLSASLGANLRKTANGDVDVLHALGGWRGLVESSLPAVLFLVIFTFAKDLNTALLVSLATAGIFTIARLVQRSKLVSALSGVLGVGICAFAAYKTGDANNYYLPGFITNGIYLTAAILSILFRWPLAGLLFGLIRSEGTRWREDPTRVKVYNLATWIIATLLALRLAVQLPLYFSEATEALGATRLLMGIPLYALSLWLAWRVSAPGTDAD